MIIYWSGLRPVPPIRGPLGGLLGVSWGLLGCLLEASTHPAQIGSNLVPIWLQVGSSWPPVWPWPAPGVPRGPKMGKVDPDPNFCCYLQHLVGVRAISLESGGSKRRFCRYLQGPIGRKPVVAPPPYPLTPAEPPRQPPEPVDRLRL